MLKKSPRDMELTSVRAIFVSDLHLGSRHAQAGKLVEFLERYDPQFVYLVGDLIDGWCLKRTWLWSPESSRAISALMQLARSGSTIRYAVGNHDDFLRNEASREMISAIGLIEVAEEFIHTTETGERLLILHGDRFDHFEQATPLVTHALSWLYNGLLCANRIWSRLTNSSEHGRYAFSCRIKQCMKWFVQHVSNFEHQMAMYARQQDCHGVVCGHIHAPQITSIEGIHYCNTGDWVENCTALVEHLDGSLELAWAYETPQTKPWQLPEPPTEAVCPAEPLACC